MADRRPLAAVSVSGGKDSTAVALLAIEADVAPRFIFADTGNEHELTLEYLYDYLPRALGHPIVDWTADQVVSYVRGKGVELNPLYRQGMGRVGCMPCINCSKRELAEIARRFPHHIDRIREWEALVSQAAKWGYTSFFTDGALEGETSEQTAARLSIDARVSWAMTTRGGRQFDLLLATDQPEPCSSVYGLCE